ncbi:S1C family serine protease [Sphingomonas japonica]|uniref:Trypsin-like peptidase domain-containing protein n=1 Tax=Sphingomonas japonica TaxID=511662 RepID=A0ABX0TZC0_9SPHN|nr:serine protease [Sphingomonas japonica]NIJ23655.1 hypothetical protein [Sphingomonas japonica]
MIRWLGLLLACLTLATPARADDISAAGRGVVRIVTIAVVDDEVVGFGHGSGFAIAPNRIVTNAHVVELAARYPGNVLIGVVPSEGDKSYQGSLIAVDVDRDLALVEFTGVRLPPLTLFNGVLTDGDPVIALGYPGNVDIATAQSAADFITPLSPVRSSGLFSGARNLVGTAVLLHSANIARGNSGGPLLDPCGRVVGVNSAITRGDDGDGTFAFAIANAELAAFLRGASQEAQVVAAPCTSIQERLEQDRDAEAAARAEAALREREAATDARIARERAIAAARADNETTRENVMALAALLLVLGALGLGGGGLLASRGQKRAAIWAASIGGVLMVAAVAAFFLRPDFDADAAVEAGADTAGKTTADRTAALGPLVCTLLPDRSRVTVSSAAPVRIEWGADGCVNGRTQYAEDTGGWERILVPEEEQTVSVLEFDPATLTYSNTRYLLSAAAMTRARELRSGVQLKACSGESAPRANLATQQSAIRNALPSLPNEKLVYRCRKAG